MLPIQPCRIGSTEEELTPIGIGTGVGHGKDSGTSVLESKVFVGEFVSVDGFAAGSVVVGEVAALAHEAWDDTVEGGAGEAKALFTCEVRQGVRGKACARRSRVSVRRSRV